MGWLDGYAKRDIQRAASILAEFQGSLVAVLPGNHDYITQRPDGLWAVFKGHTDNHMHSSYTWAYV